MSQLLKLILAGILIFTFLKMPYFYYRFAEYALFTGFGWLSYESYQRRDDFDVKVFFLIAVLYNPILRIPLPHIVWIIINILVIIGLILHILFSEDNPYDDFTKKDDR